MRQINLTEKFVRDLMVAVKQARKDNVESFTFDGHEFAPGYAEYLIEYAHGALGMQPHVTARQLREAAGVDI